MAENYLFVKGELLFKTLFFNELSKEKFDTEPVVHFTIKNAMVVKDKCNVVPEFKTKWFDTDSATQVEYINMKSKYPIAVYDKNGISKDLPLKGAIVTVCFEVTEKSMYPVGIRIDKQGVQYNPFDR